ncbi:hypothetical protein Droror1_Dr00007042 [Drosera rotundifolia]
MDPATEAERWLAIAAKLLAARDFNGSKSFAIRARDSDPNNLVSDQILSVVDTLIAADKSSKIATDSNNNQQHHVDWYAVLQLPPLSRDLDLIAAQYRRLVLLLNPERNRLPFADYALRFVVEAWSVLSDPTKKWLYDGEMSLYLQQQQAQRVEAVSAAAVRVEAPVVNHVNTFQFFQQQPMQTQPAAQQQTVNHVQQMQPQPMQPQQRQQRGVEVQQQQPMQPQQWQQRHQQQQIEQQQQQQQHEQLQLQEMWQRQQKQRLQQQQHVNIQAQIQQQEQPRTQQLQKEWQWEQLHPPAHPPQQQPQVRQEEQETVQHRNETSSERNVGMAHAIDDNGDVDDNVDVETFWTACPYCLYMYEYARDYEECTLRCQNCRRAFHAAEVPNPPPIGEGEGKDSKEASFCCWGFYPMGFSMTKWKRNNNVRDPSASWVPFSPMFACPVNGNGNAGGVYVNASVGRKFGSGGSAPRIYVDDDEAFMDLSDSDVDSDSSDDQDWRNTKKMKIKKKVKKAGRRGRVGRRPKSLRENAYQGVTAEGGALGGDDSQVRTQVADSAAAPVAAGVRSDASKRPGSSNIRKQMGRAAKDRGKLDLNLEVSNEVEDHGPIASAANGQEEPIEGIGFFEGLDEFLSSLPILNVAEDGKVKPS